MWGIAGLDRVGDTLDVDADQIVNDLRAGTPARTWRGMYTDAASYEPGDPIEVYASAAEPAEAIVRLVRLDAERTLVEEVKAMVGPQPSYLGSFVEYPTVELSGRSAFTLEGWVHPTAFGRDLVVVAGQFGLREAAAAILMTPLGQLAAYVGNELTMDPERLVVEAAPLSRRNYAEWVRRRLDTWTHVALVYDDPHVELYVDGHIAGRRAQPGPVADAGGVIPFRLGARSEAPGIDTGVFDGRLDSWALWPRPLTVGEIEARRDAGLAEADPRPPLHEVDLYVGFEGPYPGVEDASACRHLGYLTNHGSPSVAGVGGTGRALRLNRDQIVDAGWVLTTTVTIPEGTQSGMYAVELSLPPDHTPPTLQAFARAIAIRPRAEDRGAPIAVVLPTNTWLAYNYWPYGYDGYLVPDDAPGVPRRPRSPGQLPAGLAANNSAYETMGDGMWAPLFHGPRRPSAAHSPIVPSMPADVRHMVSGDANPPLAAGTVDGYSVRAPSSMHLTRWLDDRVLDYHVFSDEDLDSGVISASDYCVLMPNSHHEYWTDDMLGALTTFLDEGGSVVAPAGNIFTWRAVYDADRVMEVRKPPDYPVLGEADAISAIDRRYMGLLRIAARRNDGPRYRDAFSFEALGAQIHLTRPPKPLPERFGTWQARSTDHWLWEGSGLVEGQRFGEGTVGHEADTWVPGMPLPGLADGGLAVILAEGRHEDVNDPDDPRWPRGRPARTNDLLDRIYREPPSDAEREERAGDVPPEAGGPVPACMAGTILYFPHAGGGHVLVVGASATPWAVKTAAPSSPVPALLHRALRAFCTERLAE